jgi:hypothetical protein
LVRTVRATAVGVDTFSATAMVTCVPDAVAASRIASLADWLQVVVEA